MHLGRRYRLAELLAWTKWEAAYLLAWSLFAFPLMTLKVVAGIHWEALRLWFKGVRLTPKPPPPPAPVTLVRPDHGAVARSAVGA